MSTFDNVINLSGSTAAISYENKFLGENFGNYSRVKKITLNGHIDSRSANSDFSGVSETLSSYSTILQSAHDHTTSQFVINGRNYGKGRVLSVDFSEKNNPVRMGSFSAEIEIYESGDLLDEMGAAMYPNLRTALESNKMNLLESFSESFSFETPEDSSYSYTHSLDFKYISGEGGVDYVSQAKQLAAAIINTSTSAIDIGYVGGYAGSFDEAIHTASRHKFDETYDLTNLEFSFSKKLNAFSDTTITYTAQHSRSLTKSAEGFIDITENGKILSRTDDFTQAELGLSTITGQAYTRCSDMLTKFGGWDGSSSALTLASQYSSFGKTINKQSNSIEYNITFSNNPTIYTNSIQEYSQSIQEDLKAGTLSISENGTYRPFGTKNTTFNGISAINSILDVDVPARIASAYSNYYSDNSEFTTIVSTDNVRRVSHSIEYPKFGQSISYSVDYSVDGKFLNYITYGLSSVEVQVSDTSPTIIRKPYNVPNRGEIVQLGYQTEVGSRSISISAQKARTGNYLNNPPALGTQIDYLIQQGINEMFSIPRVYREYIIKEIWITNANYDFSSKDGTISLNMDVSFTMVGFDNPGNTNDHIETKRSVVAPGFTTY